MGARVLLHGRGHWWIVAACLVPAIGGVIRQRIPYLLT